MTRVFALRGESKQLLSLLFKTVYPLPLPKITRGAFGKPFLPPSAGLWFSLSHTGGWTLCAVSESEVGLDAQTLTPCDEEICGLYFTEAERACLSAAPAVQRGALFTRLWTLKESYLKYLGTGFFKAPNSFGIPAGALTNAAFYDGEKGCYFSAIPFLRGVSVSLCAKTPCPVRTVSILHNSADAALSLPARQY